MKSSHIPDTVGCAALLFCCTLLRVLCNGLLEWVKILLKYCQDSDWVLGCPLVLYLRPLKVLWLPGLKLEHCSVSCNDCLASASAVRVPGHIPARCARSACCCLCLHNSWELDLPSVCWSTRTCCQQQAGQKVMTFKEDFLVISVCLHLHFSEVLAGSRCPSSNTL